MIPKAYPVNVGVGSNSDISPTGLRTGLPVDWRQCLLKFDQSTDRDCIRPWFSWRKTLQRRLSPAVPREESKRVLRDRGLRSSLQTRGVTSGWEGV